MTNDTTKLTKICSSCGQEKSFAAFLQISSDKGTSYGSICSTCRKTNLETDTSIKERDDSSTRRSDNRIGAEERAHTESTQKELQKNTEEEYFESLEEREEERESDILEKENISQLEKNHRETFLKRPFQHVKAENISKTFDMKIVEDMEAANIDITNAENSRLQAEVSNPDFTKSTTDTFRQGGETLKLGQALSYFRKWVGSSAAISKTDNRFLQTSSQQTKINQASAPTSTEQLKQQEKLQQPSSTTSHSATRTFTDNSIDPAKTRDSLVEVADKTWGPKSRR